MESRSPLPPISADAPTCGRSALLAAGPSSSPNRTIGNTTAPGPRTANGSSTSRTTPATSYGISSRFPATVAKSSTSPIPPIFASLVRAGRTTGRPSPSVTSQRTEPATTSRCSTGLRARSASSPTRSNPAIHGVRSRGAPTTSSSTAHASIRHSPMLTSTASTSPPERRKT